MLGLWTAGWLAAFLLAGILWLGEPSVQWPVLAVPLLWALVALRPRRRPAPGDDWVGDDWADDDWARDDWADDEWPRDGWSRDDGWDTDRGHDDRGHDDRGPDQGWDDGEAADPRRRRLPPVAPAPAERTDTVERPAVRRPSEDDPWGRRY